MKSSARVVCARCLRTFPPPYRRCWICDVSLAPVALSREGREITDSPGPTPPVVTLAEAARPYLTERWVPEPWSKLLGTALPTGGSATLLFGDPGAGKSTLALALLGYAAAAGRNVLFIAAEMGPGPALRSIASKAGVLPLSDRLQVAGAGGVRHVEELLAAAQPEVAVVDSLQSVRAEAGDISRWRTLTRHLVVVAHVTTDGRARGGPPVEHRPDVVLKAVREKGLTVLKSRFGVTPGATVAFGDLLFVAPEASSNLIPLPHQDIGAS